MCNMEQEIKTSPVAETWVDIEGYEGLYQVSDHARVRSLDHWEPYLNHGKPMERLRKGRILIQGDNPYTGYLHVMLCGIDGKPKTKTVHRLVAKAFIPNPDNLPCINHKDECKTNNLPSNLEWCDKVYNANYGTKPERLSKAKSRTIEQLTLDGQHVAFFNSATDAARKISQFKKSNLCMALSGKSHTAYGYQWRRI